MHKYSNEDYLKALEDYAREFHEGFPTECVKDPDSIIEYIRDSIEKGEPYDPEEELRKKGIDPATIVW